MIIEILGTNYELQKKCRQDEPKLNAMDAFCDHTSKSIVICSDIDDGADVADVNVYIRKVIRHEIIHAFLYESGLGECATFDEDHYEQLVDWIAIQYPKLKEAFAKCGVDER